MRLPGGVKFFKTLTEVCESESDIATFYLRPAKSCCFKIPSNWAWYQQHRKNISEFVPLIFITTRSDIRFIEKWYISSEILPTGRADIT